jgi:SAM-dependent methyltransferase
VTVWLPRFVCPMCSTPLGEGSDAAALSCHHCGQRFDRRGEVFQFLAPSQIEAASDFAAQYRTVRARDGSWPVRPQDYRLLPWVPSQHPRADEWRIRSASYVHLQRYLLPEVRQDTLRIVDVGAGCGWLSHRLTAFGHQVVAVDRLEDEVDGLGACQHYPVSFALVRADFNALPFAPAQFDLAIFNASLHYSPDTAATLREALRVLAPGGTVAVMDSPMFVDTDDGRRMVADELRRFETEADIAAPTCSGVGFLTFGALASTAAELNVEWHYLPSRGSLRWRLKRRLAGIRLRRAPAAFGLWMAISR